MEACYLCDGVGEHDPDCPYLVLVDIADRVNAKLKSEGKGERECPAFPAWIHEN